MTFSEAQNFNAFTEALEVLTEANPKLADYYVSDYWDGMLQEWDVDMITDRVVKDIESDVLYSVAN